MKNLINNLLFRVIFAIALGILLGNILPKSVGDIFATFNALFDQLLKFLISLIIVGLIIPALTELGSPSGMMLIVTVAIDYGSALFSGFSSYFASMAIFPALLEGQSVQNITDSSRR